MLPSPPAVSPPLSVLSPLSLPASSLSLPQAPAMTAKAANSASNHVNFRFCIVFLPFGIGNAVFRTRRQYAPVTAESKDLCHFMIHPPSTFSVCPVTNDASGPTRNDTAEATSSGVPRRFRAWESMMRFE